MIGMRETDMAVSFRLLFSPFTLLTTDGVFGDFPVRASLWLSVLLVLVRGSHQKGPVFRVSHGPVAGHCLSGIVYAHIRKMYV